MRVLDGWINGEFLDLEKCKSELHEYSVGKGAVPLYYYSPTPLDLPADLEDNMLKKAKWLIVYIPGHDIGQVGGWVHGRVPGKYIKNMEAVKYAKERDKQAKSARASAEQNNLRID